jgi:hypothetical protein
MNKLRLFARSSFLLRDSISQTRNLRNSNNPNKENPSQATNSEEDPYEKLCREEKERLEQRDKESKEKNKATGIAFKVITYSSLLVVNYYILRTAYDYIVTTNRAAEKNVSLK